MEKAKELKPLGRRSYVVESNGQHYIRNRRHLKRSAEAGSAPADEWSTPSNHHDSEVRSPRRKLISPRPPLSQIGISPYYINTTEIPSELSRENFISSHVKIT